VGERAKCKGAKEVQSVGGEVWGVGNWYGAGGEVKSGSPENTESDLRMEKRVGAKM